jgi:hypothetical protein
MTPAPQPIFDEETLKEIVEAMKLRFTPEVLEEIQRIKILHAQAEVELMKVVFT